MERIGKSAEITGTVPGAVKSSGSFSRGKFILGVIVALVIMSYIIYHILGALSEPIRLYKVNKASGTVSYSLTGQVFGDFIPIISPTPGTAVYAYRDGEKVPSGARVAAVYGKQSESAERNLRLLSSKISMLRDMINRPYSYESRSAGNYYLPSLSDNVLTEIGDYKSAGSIRSSVASASPSVIYDDIEEELLRTENEMNSVTEQLEFIQYMYCADGGYFYSAPDGYKEYPGSQTAMSISFDDYSEFLSAQAGINASDNVIGCVLTGFEWYFSCIVDNETADMFFISSVYKAAFSDNTHKSPLDMTLERKEASENGRSLLVFSCDSVPSDFTFSHSLTADFTTAVYEGLSVPDKYIISEGEVSYVYIFDKGIASVRLVDILSEKCGYCIVSDSNTEGYLAQNDLIIPYTTGLREGKVIE